MMYCTQEIQAEAQEDGGKWYERALLQAQDASSRWHSHRPEMLPEQHCVLGHTRMQPSPQGQEGRGLHTNILNCVHIYGCAIDMFVCCLADRRPTVV